MWLIHHRWGTPPELQQEWNSSIQTWILALQQIHVSDWFQRNTEFKACLKKLLWLFFHHQASRIGSIAAKVVEVIPAVWWDTSKAFWAETAESIRSFFPRMLAWSRSLKTDPVPCSSYNSSVLRILPCRQRQQGILYINWEFDVRVRDMSAPPDVVSKLKPGKVGKLCIQMD